MLIPLIAHPRDYVVVAQTDHAIGLHFTLWHAIRHILRLELIDPDSTRHLHHGLLLRPQLGFFRRALPVTPIAVLMLVAVAVVLQKANLGVYLMLIPALTTPHAIIVTGMNVTQRSCSPTPES